MLILPFVLHCLVFYITQITKEKKPMLPIKRVHGENTEHCIFGLKEKNQQQTSKGVIFKSK